MSRFTVISVAVSLATLAVLSFEPFAQFPPTSATGHSGASNEIVALRAEVEILKGKASDQAHVMTSVAYHYGNLWFAGQEQNWPLAEFYWGETRSHMRWAVRVIPVRKDPQGKEIRLQEILDPIEKSAFENLHKTIASKNVAQFRDAYKAMLESCYACHVAAGKPYLRLQVPTRAPEALIRFEPEK